VCSSDLFYYLRPMRRMEEATEAVLGALERDPLSLLINNHLAYLFHSRRQTERAIRHFRNTIELDPNYALAHWLFALALSVQGDLAGALAETETLVVLSRRSPLSVGLLGSVYAALGRTAELSEIEAELDRAEAVVHVPPFCRAWIAITAGDLDRALDLFERASEGGEPMNVNINTEPYYDKLRGHPRYRRLVERMNLRP
jgi:tetratricopeptide (TPR) repeat protein